MFWRLNIPDRPDSAKQLLEISNDLASISNRLADNNSIISGIIHNAQNLQGLHDIWTFPRTCIYINEYYLPDTDEVIMLEFKMSLIFGILVVSLSYFITPTGSKRQANRSSIYTWKKLLIILTIIASIVLSWLAQDMHIFICYIFPEFLIRMPW